MPLHAPLSVSARSPCLPLHASLSASVCFLCLPLCAFLSASTCFLVCLCVLPCLPLHPSLSASVCSRCLPYAIAKPQVYAFMPLPLSLFASNLAVWVCGRICKAPNRALSAVSRNGCALAFCVLRVGAAQVAAVDPFPCISHCVVL